MLSSANMKNASARFIVRGIWIGAGVSLLFAAGARAGQQSAQQTEGPGIDHSQPNGSYESALKLLREGKYEEAAQQYKSLAATETNPGLAYAGLARAYLGLQKVDEASAAAAKAVEVAPALADAHVALGEVYFRQGRMADADREFVALIQAHTSNARAYLGEARVSEAGSYYKQARQMLEKARSLDPDDPSIRDSSIRAEGFQQWMRRVQVSMAKKKETGLKSDGQTGEAGGDKQENPAPASPCHLAARPSTMQMNLTPIYDGPRVIHGYGLAMKVNGVSSKLLLDTGASGILIDGKIAEKAKIKPFLRRGIEGIGDKGAASGYVGLAESIHIGELEFQNCYVSVVDKNSVLDDDGLIGGDVFSEYLVDIDFTNEKFRLSELPRLPEGMDPVLHNRYVAPEMRTFSPVAIFRQHLLIETWINDSGPRLFMLDTGAELNSISPSTAREFTKVWLDPRIEVKGISGTVKNVFTGDKLTLKFGHSQQVVRDIVAFDTSGISGSFGTEVAGILGFATLRLFELKIDYRDGLIDFKYEAKAWH